MSLIQGNLLRNAFNTLIKQRSRLIVLCAAVVTALDALFTAQRGWLLGFPNYDSATYLLEADVARQAAMHGDAGLAALLTLHAHAPLLQGLINFNWFLFGYGDTQALLVHFWPVLLLFSLVYWLARRHGLNNGALVAMVLVVPLPLVINGALSAPMDLLFGTVNDTWLFDDIRPDFLAAVLDAWMAALLIEHRHNPQVRSFLIAGTCFGLALATKPTAFFMTSTLLIVSMAIVLVSDWRTAVKGIIWFISPAAMILAPLIAVGQIGSVSDYLSRDVGIGKLHFSAIDLLAEIPGIVAGTLGPECLLIFALVAIVVMNPRRITGNSAGIYCGLAVLALLLPVPSGVVQIWTETPGEIMLIATAVVVVAPALHATSVRPARVTLAISGMWLTVITLSSATAFVVWPAERVATLRGNYAALRQVEALMAQHMRPGDCFAETRFLASEQGLERWMIDDHSWTPIAEPTTPSPAWVTAWDAAHPSVIAVPVTQTGNQSFLPAQYLAQSTRCTFWIMLDRPVEQKTYFNSFTPLEWQYANALIEWVHGSQNSYHQAASIKLAPQPDSYAIEVFIRR